MLQLPIILFFPDFLLHSSLFNGCIMETYHGLFVHSCTDTHLGIKKCLASLNKVFVWAKVFISLEYLGIELLG